MSELTNRFGWRRPRRSKVGARRVPLTDKGLSIGSGMTIERMDNVGIVADDLEAATSFLSELGLEMEGDTTVEGRALLPPGPGGQHHRVH